MLHHLRAQVHTLLTWSVGRGPHTAMPSSRHTSACSACCSTAARACCHACWSGTPAAAACRCTWAWSSGRATCTRCISAAFAPSGALATWAGVQGATAAGAIWPAAALAPLPPGAAAPSDSRPAADDALQTASWSSGGANGACSRSTRAQVQPAAAVAEAAAAALLSVAAAPTSLQRWAAHRFTGWPAGRVQRRAREGRQARVHALTGSLLRSSAPHEAARMR